MSIVFRIMGTSKAARLNFVLKPMKITWNPSHISFTEKGREDKKQLRSI